MIISASRRTDIPACYSPWFFNRIKERYVLVRNPFNPHQISKITLTSSVVDCIVFWTKNPAPMMGKLEQLKDYKYYFQFTLNPYGEEIENYLPAFHRRLDTFKRLSDKIGKDRVIWRYDPIFISEKYPVEFHQEKFAKIASYLKDHTEKCMLGFIDHYTHVRSTLHKFNIRSLHQEEIKKIAISFKNTITSTPIILETCTTKIDLSSWEISAGACIDKPLVEKLTGYPIAAKRDKNQRDICQCIESIDIGSYESCLNGCIYCYAIKKNYQTARRNSEKHISTSPLLIGTINQGDMIKEREMKSLKTDQMSLF